MGSPGEDRREPKGGTEGRVAKRERTWMTEGKGVRGWRMAGTNAKTCLHLRGLRAPGVGTRHEMEEIRRKTAELDKPAGFVLSGVRNEGKHEPGPWYRVVDGHRPDYRVSQRTSRLFARSFVHSFVRLFVRSPGRGNRQSASPRQVLAPLTSVGSMGRNGSAG